MIQCKKKSSDFLFYDYETFGTHTALDKPAQFACIRTDFNLKIIDEPKCFYCFPPDDYLPDPNSVLITHITPQYTKKYGTNEYNFSKKIHRMLIQPNTCIIGYNNINFDDEITRNIFYRNFFDPYEWSWKNGNSRWDLLNILRTCYVLRPKGIKWPKNQLGLSSFKLSDLTKINNIIHLNAHDAMSDVYATLEMAKLVKKKQPKLFNFFFHNRKKNKLCKLINFNKFKPIIYISSYFGAYRDNFSCIIPIMVHQNNNNIIIAVDLFKDVEILIDTCKKLSCNKNGIKNLFDLGIVFLYLNRCPMLAPIEVIRKEDFDRLNFNYDVLDKNINLLKKNNHLIKKIIIILSQEKYINKSLNVDAKIYDAFFNSHDKKIITVINNTAPIFLKNTAFKFHDPRLENLFFRYRARNFFSTLDRKEKEKWLRYCLSIFNPICLKEYKHKIECLLKQHANNIEKIKLLKKLLDYVVQQREKLFLDKINLN